MEALGVTKTVPSMTILKILLVEDAEDNIMLMKAFLRKSQHLVDVAHNGQEGVEMVQKGDYDLVLMDVQMPVMDGYRATEAIRLWETEKNRHPLPIIALTGHIFPEDIQKILDVGCNQHLTKPVSKAKLLEVITRHGFGRKNGAADR